MHHTLFVGTFTVPTKEFRNAASPRTPSVQRGNRPNDQRRSLRLEEDQIGADSAYKGKEIQETRLNPLRNAQKRNRHYVALPQKVKIILFRLVEDLKQRSQ